MTGRVGSGQEVFEISRHGWCRVRTRAKMEVLKMALFGIYIYILNDPKSSGSRRVFFALQGEGFCIPRRWDVSFHRVVVSACSKE